MSKKSKKSKRNDQLELKTLRATDIDYYITSKFEISNEDFWDWFFEECPYRESNLLDLSDDLIYPKEYREYIRLIADEFQEDVDEDFCLEIENDI